MLDFGEDGTEFTTSTPRESLYPDLLSQARPPRPRYKPIDRSQDEWRQFSIDELIDRDHPARAIWDFLDQLDLSAFEQGIKAVEGSAGQDTFEPRLLIALWLLACSEGVGSARQLSRLIDQAPAYRWLCGGRPMNYHTLATFRVANKAALDQLFVQVLAVLHCEGLITLERVTHDGTRIRSVADSDSLRTRKKLEKSLEEAARQVEAMGDPEEPEPSVREKKARERAARERRERLEQAREQLEKIQAASPKAKRSKRG